MIVIDHLYHCLCEPKSTSILLWEGKRSSLNIETILLREHFWCDTKPCFEYMIEQAHTKPRYSFYLCKRRTIPAQITFPQRVLFVLKLYWEGAGHSWSNSLNLQIFASWNFKTSAWPQCQVLLIMTNWIVHLPQKESFFSASDYMPIRAYICFRTSLFLLYNTISDSDLSSQVHLAL